MIETMDVQDIEQADMIAQHGPFVMTPTGVVVTGEASYEEWTAAYEWARKAEKASPFWVGDLLVYGDGKWGDKYTQAVEDSGLSKQHLMNMESVAKRVPPERRHADLSFSHHAEVASLPPVEQEQWLTKAENDGLSVKDLRHQVKVQKAQAAGQTVELGVWAGCNDLDDQAALYDQLVAAGRAVKKTSREIA